MREAIVGEEIAKVQLGRVVGAEVGIPEIRTCRSKDTNLTRLGT